MAKKKRTSKRYTTSRTRRYNILNFTFKDTFFWDVTKYEHLIKDIFDFEDIKLEEEELIFLNDLIKILKEKQEILKYGYLKEIKILPVFKEIFAKIRKYDEDKIKYIKDIKEIINSFPKNYSFHLKDIKNELLKKKEINISKNKIFNLIKSHLQFRYLKTTIKNSSLDENKSIFMSFIFIKAFIRAIKMDIKPIYIDETGLMLKNNNYRRWRVRNSDINIGPKTNTKIKSNLIVASLNDEILFNTITTSNCNTKVFKKFITNLINLIPKKNRNEYIIILDNATYHKSLDIIELLLKSKIKVLTTTPYFSKLNMAEYIFRHIKNITYKKSYNTITELNKDVKNILQSDKLKSTIQNLYKYTLQNYREFIGKYNNEKYNLNEIYDNKDSSSDIVSED